MNEGISSFVKGMLENKGMVGWMNPESEFSTMQLSGCNLRLSFRTSTGQICGTQNSGLLVVV